MPWKGHRSVESYNDGGFNNAPEGLPFRALHQNVFRWLLR